MAAINPVKKNNNLISQTFITYNLQVLTITDLLVMTLDHSFLFLSNKKIYVKINHDTREHFKSIFDRYLRNVIT